MSDYVCVCADPSSLAEMTAERDGWKAKYEQMKRAFNAADTLCVEIGYALEGKDVPRDKDELLERVVFLRRDRDRLRDILPPATERHREVELDLFETYAEYIVAILNDQLIPQLIAQNWGTADEVPFVEVEITRPEREQEMATRDKTLFVDMGLPVSLQYLYERHKVPSPAPSEALFQPAKPIAPLVPPSSVPPATATMPVANAAAPPPEEPPHVLFRSYGFSVAPKTELNV